MKIDIATNVPIPHSGPDMVGNVYPVRGGFGARKHSQGLHLMTNKAGEQPTITLLPCPVSWCTDPRPQKSTSGNLHYIRCNECGTKTPLFYSSTQAIAAWNTRTTSLAAQDGLVEALEEIGRLAETLAEYDGEVCNVAEYILSAHRTAMAAIKGDKM